MEPGGSSAWCSTMEPSESAIHQSIPSVGEMLPALPRILPGLEVKAMLLRASPLRIIWTGATVFGKCQCKNTHYVDMEMYFNNH